MQEGDFRHMFAAGASLRSCLFYYSLATFSPTSCAKNMGETEDYHFLGGDLSALERSRLERKLSNLTSGL